MNIFDKAVHYGIEWRLGRIPGFGGEPHKHMASYAYWAPYLAGHQDVLLGPDSGSAASLYRFVTTTFEEYDPGWFTFTARLEINGMMLGVCPGAIYMGQSIDIPSCLIRFSEKFGPYSYDYKTGQHVEGAPGTWLLTGAFIGPNIRPPAPAV